ncbi:MAG: UDP-N-acetylglucosamine 1-carboxyvinyltransferase [Verrucomicrobia bacterium]|nr:UDP-N-acetylglucosamine 1-carboxyvinyltransferase [Verrucomicrobiota bacterium]MDA1088290.1 UDP-N-acetylglucosamine 1-carboxyvinyltransferase [Verrucomicrobiota bacterium]
MAETPRFVIQGGCPLCGDYTPSGNKNAVLPMLAAAILTEEPVELRNVPLIDDVDTMLEILSALGATVSRRGHTVHLNCSSLTRTRLPAALCRRLRSSILFAGPLAARHGRATLHPPGGDVIGRRRVDSHFDGLAALGIRVSGDRSYAFHRDTLRGCDMLLDEASVTATENIMMAASIAEGRTTILNAASEPHVQALCEMLNGMGARIEGIGTNCLTIDGVSELGGVCRTVPPDHIEIGSFIAASAVTGGSLTIHGIRPADLAPVERAFARLGVCWKIKDGTLNFPKPSLRIVNDFGAAVPKIEDGAWPSFPSDLMSVAIVMATQARGTMLFFEKMFESRLYFVDRLIEMGARIVQCDPHRVMVVGPAQLHGTRMASPDIRAGMAMLVAALCADGESVIGNADVIDRGYETVERKLRRLGADIRRLS